MLFERTTAAPDVYDSLYLHFGYIISIPPSNWFPKEKERLRLSTKANRNVRRRLYQEQLLSLKQARFEYESAIFMNTDEPFWIERSNKELEAVNKAIEGMYFLINAIDHIERMKEDDLSEMQHASR